MIEFRKLVNVIPYLFSGSMENMRTISVHLNSLYFFCVNISADVVLKLFHIEEPIAKGVAIGSASHAVGTAKAMELGEIEGAMSSLSIAVAGILTVVVAMIYSNFI